MNASRTDWHRLFGMLVSDFFTGTPYTVEIEKDLSLKQQYLDVVILRKRPGEMPRQLPDGLDNLSAHNLITFKSHREALDDWALKELTGHYVNYRKQVSESFDRLLPETDFRLYAVCSRHPDGLERGVTLRPIDNGVYECRRGSDEIRVIVLRELPAVKHNALWHVVSGKPGLMGFAARNFEQHSVETSSLIIQVLQGMQAEGLTMAYTMEDFRREFREQTLPALVNELTPEQIVKMLGPEKLEAVTKLVKKRETAGKPKRKKK